MKLVLKSSLIVGMLAVGGFVAETSAAVIVGYNFDTGTSGAGTSTPPSAIDSNASATDFTTGSGIDSTKRGRSSGGLNYFAASDATSSTEASSVSTNDYFVFTVTPDANFELDLTSFSFNYGGNASSNTVAFNYSVRTSLDAYASNLTPTPNAPLTYTTSSNSLTQTPNLATFSLGGPSYQGLTGPLEVRIYVWDNSEVSTVNARVDNVVLEGIVESTVVPEPMALSTIGMVAVAGLLRRRRTA